jgi:hypothetical protein
LQPMSCFLVQNCCCGWWKGKTSYTR